MSPIAVLDEWIVAVDAAFALLLQATPLVVLIAVGALLIGAALVSAGASSLAASMLQSLVRVDATAAGRRRRRTDELLLPLVPQILRPEGARGARAPGRVTPRPLLQG